MWKELIDEGGIWAWHKRTYISDDELESWSGGAPNLLKRNTMLTTSCLLRGRRQRSRLQEISAINPHQPTMTPAPRRRM
jgi:hypothetical protein